MSNKKLFKIKNGEVNEIDHEEYCNTETSNDIAIACCDNATEALILAVAYDRGLIDYDNKAINGHTYGVLDIETMGLIDLYRLLELGDIKLDDKLPTWGRSPDGYGNPGVGVWSWDDGAQLFLSGTCVKDLKLVDYYDFKN